MFTVNLFTNSLKITQIISRNFHVKDNFIEKKIKNKALLKFCIKNGIKINKDVKNFSKIKNFFFNNADLAIIYGCGIIFKKNYISKYKYGMWNIHPGDLPKYRGRHPISWAFLNNEKKIGITIHKINEKIDQGKFLIKDFVNRDLQDDENNIKEKIFTKLPKLIKKALKKIKSKKLIKIGKGNYHPPLYHGVKIKNPIKYDFMYVYNAIKAQSVYGGIKIGKTNFKNVFFYNKKKLKTLKNFNVVKCKNNKKLILVR